MMKKLIATLLLVVTLMGMLPMAQAEVERSPFLDAAFRCLEKDNIFQRRYNEITGAQVESIFDLGIPYYFGGKYMERITSRLPEFSKYKCWETTKFYRKDKFYIDGFDCSGYTQWIYSEVGMPAHDSLSNMILKWDYQRAGNHLYNHREGFEMPPYDELKDHLIVGDLLVAKHGARHIMMYIGTLRDYNFTAEDMKNIVIAYEPVWAIGTGLVATKEQAEEVCQHIRTVVRKLFGSKNARATTILYGGSMNDKNAYELLAQPDIDGGLIGGASLVPEKFVKIIEDANQPII